MTRKVSKQVCKARKNLPVGPTISTMMQNLSHVAAGIKGKVEFEGNQASGDYPAMFSMMNIETGQSGSATGD